MLGSILSTILLLLGTVRSWEKCTIEPIPGCTCWDVDRPEVNCDNLDLYTLPDLGNPTWYSLDLSSNHLSSIVGLNGVSLRYLHLEYNLIRSLMGDFLEDSWESLEWLDLSHNQLQWIFKKDLEHFTNLRVLKLEYNQLEGFLSADDTPLPSLRVLHLHQNPLSGLINLPDYIDELTLTVETAALDLPASIQVERDFTMTDTNLTGDWEKLFSKLKANKNLRTLSLINCGLKNLGTWSGLSKFSRKLLSVNLAHNDMTEIPHFAYHFRPSHFKKVDLSYNEIKFLYTRDFRQFSDLETILLHRNYISTISGTASVPNNLEFIRWIDFSDNLISGKLRKADIPTRAFDDPGSVLILLGNNKFDCSCDLKWLWDVAKNQTSGHPGFLAHHDINQNLTCYITKDTFVRLIDYDMEGQGCEDKDS